MAFRFLDDRTIEQNTLDLLEEFKQRSGLDDSPPVDVEAILEIMYDIIPEPIDLRSAFGEEDGVLGRSVLYSDGRVILQVDQSIYPYEPYNHYSMVGRYRFTVAHELGHICLHLDAAIQRANASNLWNGEDAFVFSRTRNSDFTGTYRPKASIEIQADLFARYILMPTRVVLEAWEACEGGAPINVYEELQEKRKTSKNPEYVLPDVVWQMADLFHVSGSAMNYRLNELNLLKNGKVIQRIQNQ